MPHRQILLSLSLFALALTGCSESRPVTPDPDGGGGSCTLPTPDEHRAAGAMCDDSRSFPEIEDWAAMSGGSCASHEECADEGDNGRCTVYPRGFTNCTADRCFGDSDCGAGPCVCGTGDFQENRCLAGNCQTDSDCGPGGFCSPSFGDCGNYSGVIGFFCHTCEDECTNDSDCGGTGEGYDPYCAFDPAREIWACSDSHCVG